MTDTFNHDEYSRKHLREWYDYGSAPENWYTEDLLAFERWVEINQHDHPITASWPELVSAYNKAMEHEESENR